MRKDEMITYKRADPLSAKELKRFKLKSRYGSYLIRAISTGVFRRPKKGEWFLSGAIVEAYMAPCNMSVKYFIARLVRVRFEKGVTIEKVTVIVEEA